jgi:Importin-beta N-terminal domain
MFSHWQTYEGIEVLIDADNRWELMQNATTSGYAAALLSIASMEDLGLEMRQIAAITFKNQVKAYWEIRDTRAGM